MNGKAVAVKKLDINKLPRASLFQNPKPNIERFKKRS